MCVGLIVDTDGASVGAELGLSERVHEICMLYLPKNISPLSADTCMMYVPIGIDVNNK